MQLFNLPTRISVLLRTATVNRHRDALSKMFSIAVENGYVDANPVKSIKKLKENNTKMQFLKKEEEVRLFKYLPEYLKPVVTCALHTGMRRGELLNLKWDNIYLNKGYIELLETKNNKKRIIPISNKLNKILEQLKEGNNSEFVFVSKETQKPYKDFRDSFNSALTSAKINKFVFHDLRHTFRLVVNLERI